VRAPFILNVSSIKKKKNIDGLVRAFARLKKEGYPHQLVLVGKADSGAEEVRRLVGGLGLEKDVLLTGFVDEEDHPHFYRQAQIMVYPSFYEGFGLPILEAMACGCPVITSGVSSMPEVAGDAAVLIDPGDVDSIAAAMKELLNGPEKCESLISRGLERAGTFTWQKSAEAHMELYRRILKWRYHHESPGSNSDYP
jgi:glycosyltransferase involved in cell wall biosynthesis